MPLSPAVCVPASVAMVKVPVRAPDAVGVNTMETVHPVCAARVVPQVFVRTVKSPVMDAAPRPPLPVPVLLIVMFCTGLVEPIVVDPKLSVVGVSTTLKLV